MRREIGFSLVEALIAAALLLVIAVGVLPLFTRAMINNVAGNDSTSVTNFGRSDVEEFFQLSWDNPALAITAGDENAQPLEYRSEGADDVLGDELWTTTAPTTELSMWERQTTVRQYAVNAFDDGILTEDDALDSGAETGRIHLKGIEVEVRSRRDASSPLNVGKQLTLLTLKSQ